MPSPFRDELETLRRENQELRMLLSRSRATRPMLAFALAASDIGAALSLRPWLNGDSDLRFWAALGILGAITLAAGWAAVGYKRRVR